MKNVVDSNEINGWLIQPIVHGAGWLGWVANHSCSRRVEPGTVSDRRWVPAALLTIAVPILMPNVLLWGLAQPLLGGLQKNRQARSALRA